LNGEERFSVDGETDNTLSWAIDDNSFTWNEEGVFSNLPEFFDEFGQESYSRRISAVLSENPPSINVEHTINMDGPQGPQSASDVLTIEGSVGGDGGDMTFNAEIDYVKEVSGFDQYIADKYPEWSDYSSGYTFNANSAIRVNPDACGDYFDNDLSGSCNIQVRTNRVFNGESPKRSFLRIQGNDQGIKVVANPHVGTAAPHFVTIKSENAAGESEELNAYNFWSINYREAGSPEVLVLRVPLCNGLEQHVFPLIEDWARTYETAFDAIDSFEGFVYAIWYADQIIASIPAGEFNCAPIVDASRLDSDIFHLNAQLTEACRGLDFYVQMFVAEQPLADELNAFRAYVRELNSDASKAEVRQLAENAFAL